MSYTPLIVGINLFLTIIATLAIILRVISRKLADAGFWWDDWLALAAWVRRIVLVADRSSCS